MYPISRHTLRHHAYDPECVGFIVLDWVHQDPRGRDYDKRILQLEARWIYNLKATCIPGLNDSNSFKSFS